MHFGPDHEQFRGEVRAFVAREIAPHIDARDDAEGFSRELYGRVAAFGLLGIGYPQALGGTPADWGFRLIVTEEIARAGSCGLMAGLFSQNIGLLPLLAAGSAALQRRVVPPVLAGRKIAAFAVTEPGHGSDVARLKTRARCAGDHWVLDGEKLLMTCGLGADWITVVARTGGRGAAGLSLFAVPGDARGLTRTPLKKMGWCGSDTAAHFDACRIPIDHLIGDENAGFGLLMENFNGERLMLSAGAVAFAQVCLDEALEWVREREALGTPLPAHQAIRNKLADMRTRIEASRARLHELVARLEGGDAGEEWVADLCLLKNHAMQTLQHCADQAVQILGSTGFMRRTKSERIYREVKSMTIGGGTRENTKERAARQLGIVR